MKLVATLSALLLAACGPTGDVAPANSESSVAADGVGIAGVEPPAIDRFAKDFRAIGTDPFWAAHVTDGRLRYMTPSNQEGVAIEVEDVTPAEQTNIIELSGTLNSQELKLTGRIEPCQDGLSDREYPYAVTLWLDDEERKGCARPTDASL